MSSVKNIAAKAFSKLATVTVIVSLSLLTTSCSGKVSYRFLDWIVAWSVDDYVDWDRQQQREFDQRLEALLEWHQATQLPAYSEFLTRFESDLQRPLNEEILNQYVENLQALLANTVEKALPDAVFLLSTLSDEQVQEFAENLDKENRKIEKKYLRQGSARLNNDRERRVKKSVERLVGRLNSDQKLLVSQWGEEVQDSRQQWLQNRQKWAQQFVSALEQRHSDEFAGEMRRLLVDSQSLWNEEYKQLMTSNINLGIRLAINLQGSLAEKQRQRLLEDIGEWRQTFDELAAEMGPDSLAHYAN